MKLFRTFLSSLVATALSGAFLLSGCGAPQSGEGDGGTPPPPEAPSAITGKAEIVFRDNYGTLTREPLDMHTTFVSAVFPEGGGFRTVSGTSGADGVLDVPTPASGGYWLRLFDGPAADDVYLWTDSGTFSVEVHAAGRPDVERATKDTTVAFFNKLEGISPAEDQDGFELVSGNLGYNKPLFLFPAAGATALTGSIPWNTMPLIDSAKNDDVTLVQYRHHTDPATTLSYYSIVKSAQLSDVSMKDGEINALTGTFSTPPDLTYALAWKRTAFAALRPQINPQAGDPSGSFSDLVVQPGGADFGETGRFLPEVFALDPDAFDGMGDLDTSFEIHNPFPDGWLINHFMMEFPVDLPVPGDPAASHTTAYASIGVNTSHLPDSAHPIVPVVSPVRDLKIGGKDAYTDQTGVGAAPVLSWTAPEIGTPTGYSVNVYEWEGVADGVGGLVYRGALMIPGDQTSVQLPPTLLRKGQQYVMTLRAIHQDGQDVRTHGLFTPGMDYAWADSVTGSFSP